MSFDTLGLSKPILHAIEKVGYKKASAIQEKAIPLILERADVLGSAQTGTGKTASFTLPILQILSESKQPKRRPVRALILTPTRELAAQVSQNVVAYSEFLHLESTMIFGGVNQNPQVRALRNGVDILIATPGRLLDLFNQGHVSLSKVEILVLDEADRMLDMGFLRDIRKILETLPPRRQNLLFSATFSKQIKELAGTFMRDPILIEATPENTTVEKIHQRVIHVDKAKKATLLIEMIDKGGWSQALVFTRTKYGANRLSEKIAKRGITSAAIHGNKSQGARTKALEGFKAGEVRVLVATDIAARGLDIPLLPHVVNYELPNVPEDYVHRIGRTGRAGANGEAISLVTAEEMELVWPIEELINEQFEVETVEGFESKEKIPAKKQVSRPSSKKKKKPKSEKASTPQDKSSGFYRKKKKGKWRGDRGRNAKKY